MGDGALAIMQATSGTPPRPSTRVDRTRQTGVMVDLYLETKAGEEVVPPGDEDNTLVVEAGISYRVTIVLFPAIGSPQVAFRGQSWFSLSWQGTDRVSHSTERHGLSADDVAGGAPEMEFELDVSASAPIGTGRLRLRYEVGSVNRFHDLAEVRIRSRYHAPAPAFQLVANVSLAAEPDPQLAIVHVSAVADGISVKAFHPIVGPLAAVLPLPSIDFDLNDDVTLEDLHPRVREYSRQGIGVLIAWLDRVIKAVPDVAVVIAEHMDSRVPWEMLSLGEDGPLLGDSVVVVRWTMVGHFATAKQLNPAAEPFHKGRVLKFLDVVGLDHTDKEVQELSQCASESCDSLADLRRKLKKFPAGVALVFLACHGTFARDKRHETELKDLKNPHGRITPLKLVGLSAPAPRPAVVINACHSARLVRTPQGISGFPEFFLGTFAESFLGTIGAVDDEVASDFGAQLVLAARQPGGVRLAEFLLRLRRQAVAEFKRDERVWKYVSYFMYVFYGSPRDRLELEPLEEAVADD